MNGDIVDRVGGPAGVILVVICILGGVSTVKFIVQYQRQAGWAWWHNSAGRFIMLSRLNLLALLVIIVFNRFAGEWPGRDAVTLTLMATFIVQATVWPNRILNKLDRKEHRTDDPDTEPENRDAGASPVAGDAPHGPGDGRWPGGRRGARGA